MLDMRHAKNIKFAVSSLQNHLLSLFYMSLLDCSSYGMIKYYRETFSLAIPNVCVTFDCLCTKEIGLGKS